MLLTKAITLHYVIFFAIGESTIASDCLSSINTSIRYDVFLKIAQDTKLSYPIFARVSILFLRNMRTCDNSLLVKLLQKF